MDKTENGHLVIHALICSNSYKTGNENTLITAHVVICFIFLLALICIGIFIKRMALFPIKERAPKLALLQGILFLMIVVIPYLSDFWVNSWAKADLADQIPMSRKFFKSFYLSMRLFCYFIFGIRTVIIYSNWKLGEYKDKKYGKRKERSKC